MIGHQPAVANEFTHFLTQRCAMQHAELTHSCDRGGVGGARLVHLFRVATLHAESTAPPSTARRRSSTPKAFKRTTKRQGTYDQLLGDELQHLRPVGHQQLHILRRGAYNIHMRQNHEQLRRRIAPTDAHVSQKDADHKMRPGQYKRGSRSLVVCSTYNPTRPRAQSTVSISMEPGRW